MAVYRTKRRTESQEQRTKNQERITAMKVSLNWLKDFVEVPPDLKELKQGLTMLGLEVESLGALDGDCVFDLEVTTNRPDCLNHYGVAREVATWYRKPLKRL